MAYNIREITREKIHELLIKGSLTFEATYQIKDEVKEAINVSVIACSALILKLLANKKSKLSVSNK